MEKAVQAIYIPFRDTENPVFSDPLETIVGIFSMSVGDFEDLYEYFSELSSPFQGICKAIFCVYMIMVTILLVNILIAMMGRTYEMVTNSQKEWFRQWANIVLVLEQTVTTVTITVAMSR
ncbi:hypothetical protein RRG08_040329 [Elysia crispata]|uniref:Ion transport domain-containing protein n=1 Tax=Elysia crispata TaxID=231223 RepID=A0AAE1DY13_9GAST|nr:hypothetical protein RRG08_040329 [Elysia crispata]